MLKQEFIIHPVGQGLFYSLKITHNSSTKFRMFYDCGSLTKGAGESEVTQYRSDVDFTTEKILDLLVISHFDADHVNFIGILTTGIKIKKLVMPFITIEERLFLVLKALTTEDISDDWVNLVLDPLEYLKNNLDGDSEVFLIDSSPSSDPINDMDLPNDVNDKNEDQFRYEFDFDSIAKKSSNTIFKSTTNKIYTVDHRHKAFIKTLGTDKIMEFIFYKKAIGIGEISFYNAVKEEFINRYKIQKVLNERDFHDEITRTIKIIKGGRIIRDIFSSAKRKMGFKVFSGLNINDLNTTALCMLHLNLPPMKKLLENKNTYSQSVYSICKYSGIDNGKFLGYARLEPKFTFLDKFLLGVNNHFPNTLLTSDIFLLEQGAVEEFIEHYKDYFSQFWLFQIPHHGAERNSNKILHSTIPNQAEIFINYGIHNSHNHPSLSVINDLTCTGNSSKIISINEIQGLLFSIED